MIAGTSLKAAAALAVGHPAQATLLESTSATTTYHRVTVDGVGVFYREAGPKDAPTIVLLHGFPSSSREFDTFIPLLATRYHLSRSPTAGTIEALWRLRGKAAAISGSRRLPQGIADPILTSGPLRRNVTIIPGGWHGSTGCPLIRAVLPRRRRWGLRVPALRRWIPRRETMCAGKGARAQPSPSPFTAAAPGGAVHLGILSHRLATVRRKNVSEILSAPCCLTGSDRERLANIRVRRATCAMVAVENGRP